MDPNCSTFSVQLYIYDLSRGMARQLSPIMLGKQLDGIWHTSVVVYGEEFFFGGVGISSCTPGGTMLGPPDSVVELGDTEVTEEIFMDYLSSLGETTYRGERYRLFEHNCNTFTNEVAQFLTGRNIPSYITDLPSEVLSTPFGQVLRPILDSIHIAPPGGNIINSQNNHQNKPIPAMLPPPGQRETFTVLFSGPYPHPSPMVPFISLMTIRFH